MNEPTGQHDNAAPINNTPCRHDHSGEQDLTRATLLMRLGKDGSSRELAWSEFVRLYVPIIQSYARSRGAAPSVVDDISQEVLRRFYQAVPQFKYDRERGKFRTYLRTCTRRVMHDLATRTHRDAGREMPLDETQVEGADQDDTWDTAWQRHLFELALAAVRRNYSQRAKSAVTLQAFEMYALFEQPPDTVALKLGISIDSVHQAKSRVLSAIQEEVEKLGALLD